MTDSFRNFVIVLFSILLSSCVDSASFDIRFGVLKESNDGKKVIDYETNKIHYVTREEGQEFGIVITPSSSEEYTTSKVVYLPGVPKVLTGTLEGERPTDAPKGYRSPTYRSTGTTVHIMGLDEGDPVGIYTNEVYINGELAKEFSFEVLSKNK